MNEADVGKSSTLCRNPMLYDEMKYWKSMFLTPGGILAQM